MVAGRTAGRNHSFRSHEQHLTEFNGGLGEAYNINYHSEAELLFYPLQYRGLFETARCLKLGEYVAGGLGTEKFGVRTLLVCGQNLAYGGVDVDFRSRRGPGNLRGVQRLLQLAQALFSTTVISHLPMPLLQDLHEYQERAPRSMYVDAFMVFHNSDTKWTSVWVLRSTST